MNKYTKMFMDDNNLKVGDEFRKKGTDAYDIWHFNEDGRIENKRGIGSNKVLIKFLLGEWEVEKVKKWPWKPKLNEKYWFVSQYGLTYNIYNNDEDDKYKLTHYPVFQTEEEAEDYKWFLDKADEYKKPFEIGKVNYYFCYDHEDENIYRTCDISCQGQGNIFFGDEENIKKFIDEVGEERIKKYMFGI